MKAWRAIAFAAAVFGLGACGQPDLRADHPPAAFLEEDPDLLSAWGMLRLAEAGVGANEGVAVYHLATPLFSDYAQKLRTLWLPPGTQVSYAEEGVLDFPIGTVLTKTFYYPDAANGSAAALPPTEDQVVDPGRARLLETRILVRRAEGWRALVYVWNEAETDATLARAGGRIALRLMDEAGAERAFTYHVPNVTQCAACHAPNATTRDLAPIGPSVRNLAAAVEPGEAGAQLAALRAAGWLVGGPEDFAEAPRLVAWTDESAPLEARARAYLDVNCAHCHNAVGPADTSGLVLEAHAPFGAATGLCKLPVAAGSGTGDRRFDIVPGDPAASVLIYRLETEDPAAMMPEIGRSVSHREGVALLSRWIEAMEGSCS